MGAGVHFYARSCAPSPWMRVGMNVVAAIHPNTTPRRAIEIDGVRAPQKIRMHPSKREKSRGDDHRRPPPDRSANEKSRGGRAKHHERDGIGNIDLWRSDRQDFHP